MELDCALRDELISFFDDETLSQTKSKSPRPIRLPRFNSYRILFSQKDGWDLQEKALKETRRELEEGRRERCATLVQWRRLGVNSNVEYCMGRPSLPSLIFIA